MVFLKKHGTAEVTSVMTTRHWVPVLWNPKYAFSSTHLPTLATAILMGGCVSFWSFHHVMQLALGICNPTLVVMEPGKEGRKATSVLRNIPFFRSWLLCFSTWEKDHSNSILLNFALVTIAVAIIKATYKRKNLLEAYRFSRLESMTIMRSMAACRQA